MGVAIFSGDTLRNSPCHHRKVSPYHDKWRDKERKKEGSLTPPPRSSIFCTVYKFFASQSQYKYKIIIFFSGDVNDEANFSFFILLHKRDKPILPPLPSPSPPPALSLWLNRVARRSEQASERALAFKDSTNPLLPPYIHP